VKKLALVLLLGLGSLFAEPFGADGFRITKQVGSAARSKNAMATGQNSRVEIVFPDHTIARIGAHAKFRFVPGSREAVLDGGTLLFSLPREVGGVTLYTGNLVIVSRGGDFSAYDVAGRNKVVCLTGKVDVAFASDPKQKARIVSGEMIDVFPGATTMPLVTKVSLSGIMNSSLLMGMGVLPSQSQIEKKAQAQQKGGGAPAPIPQVSNTTTTTQTAGSALAVMREQTIQRTEAATALAAQQAAAEAAAQQQALAAQRQAAAAAEQAQRLAQQNQGNQGNAFGPGGNPNNTGGGGTPNNGQGNQGNNGGGNPNNGQGNQGQGNGQGNQGGGQGNIPPGQAKKQ
jgi:FecR protein